MDGFGLLSQAESGYTNRMKSSAGMKTNNGSSISLKKAYATDDELRAFSVLDGEDFYAQGLGVAD